MAFIISPRRLLVRRKQSAGQVLCVSSLAGHDELGHTAHWLCMLRGMTATQPCQLPREQQVRLKTRKIRSGRLPEFSYGTVYVQLEDGSHCARANISCIRVSLCPFRAIKNPKENAFLALKTRKIFWPAGAQLSVLRRQKQGFLPVHKIASLYCERPLRVSSPNVYRVRGYFRAL